MKFGCIAASHLRRGTVIESACLAPFKSVKYMGYENTTRDREISIQQLYQKKKKKSLISAQGKPLQFKPMALQDSWDSVDVIWAEPMAARHYGMLWNWDFLKG